MKHPSGDKSSNTPRFNLRALKDITLFTISDRKQRFFASACHLGKPIYAIFPACCIDNRLYQHSDCL